MYEGVGIVRLPEARREITRLLFIWKSSKGTSKKPSAGEDSLVVKRETIQGSTCQRFDSSSSRNNIMLINMKIKFKRLSEKAVMPIRATKGSSGYDLVCTDITTELNECGQMILVYHTGLAVEIPEGYEAQMRPRSSISKKSMRMCNAPGTIDSDRASESGTMDG